MACCETFGMRKSELFEAFDLFDVRDFGKVITFHFLRIIIFLSREHFIQYFSFLVEVGHVTEMVSVSALCS